MYAASTTAVRRASFEACCVCAAGDAASCVFVLCDDLARIALPFVRKYDDHRSSSSINVVQ
jgi:hypothetical protein